MTILMRLFAVENLLNWLLVFVPVAIVLELTHANPAAIFAASCLAIIPLAGLMGKATEHLAEKVGEGVGGLLNATFGNAAELIIAVVALNRGLTDVVKASITGSIIGNILLVFGLSALCGGLRFSIQKFNQTAANLGTTMLTLSVVGVSSSRIVTICCAMPMVAFTGFDRLTENVSSGSMSVSPFTVTMNSLLSVAPAGMLAKPLAAT